MNKKSVIVAQCELQSMKRLKIEAKIYEVVGVRSFRRCVFALEKWIHRRDNGTNINYHISSTNSDSIREFIKFLFYNGSIHARNLVYFCVFCIFRYSLYHHLHFLDILPFTLAVKDLYCVMLQRYNYIQIQLKLPRLDELRRISLDKKIRKTALAIENMDYDFSTRQADYQLVQKLRMLLDSGESIVLDEKEKEVYVRLSQILSEAKKQR